MNLNDAALAVQIFINIAYILRRLRSRKQQAQQVLAPKRRRPPSVWCRPWNTADQRLLYGDWNNLIVTLRLEDPDKFLNYCRMPGELFDELLYRVRNRITKEDTHYRKALEPGLKLALTLRHLASGDKYPSLAYNYRVSRSSVNKMIPEVCTALHEVLVDEVMIIPTDPAGWKEVSEKFRSRWNVPHALGALDGKHIRIRQPHSSGSLYHNYKGFFSVVLMALCDADYKFMFADVGGVGHQSDAQIYNDSELMEALEDGDLNIPHPEPLPHDIEDMPYFFLGDDAFALKENMMKPFAQRGLDRNKRLFNYRIARGRRVIENTFGILAQRFQIFLGTMQQEPEVVIKIVHAAICLHNLLRLRYPKSHINLVDSEDKDGNIIPGAWRNGPQMLDINKRYPGNRQLEVAKRQREVLMHYFISEAGKVPWQDRMVPL